MCLSSPSNEFVTDEMWLVGPEDHSNGQPTWVELGYMGYGGGGVDRFPWAHNQPPGRYTYWADNRPAVQDSTGGFNLHWLEQLPTFPSIDLVIGKDQGTTGDYNITTTHGTTIFTAESLRNYMDPNQNQYGSESTSNASHSYGLFSGTGYKKQGSWYNGMENESAGSDHAQTFTWVNRPHSFDAGMLC